MGQDVVGADDGGAAPVPQAGQVQVRRLRLTASSKTAPQAEQVLVVGV